MIELQIEHRTKAPEHGRVGVTGARGIDDDRSQLGGHAEGKTDRVRVLRGEERDREREVSARSQQGRVLPCECG